MQKQLRVGSQVGAIFGSQVARGAGDEQRKGFNKENWGDQMIKELIGILTNYWEFIRYNNI